MYVFKICKRKSFLYGDSQKIESTLLLSPHHVCRYVVGAKYDSHCPDNIVALALPGCKQNPAMPQDLS
jgi:hypothetical protein